MPFPESPDTDNEALGRSFRGTRGRVLLRESVQVTAAGGPAPATDWRPADLTPDIKNSMAVESLDAARATVALVFGVLPALLDPASTGPGVREAQRHLAVWTLQPMAEVIAEEAGQKLGGPVSIDVVTPLQAYDQTASARALGVMVQTLATAKEAGLTSAELAPLLAALDWSELKG